MSFKVDDLWQKFRKNQFLKIKNMKIKNIKGLIYISFWI